ncbi:MAG: type II toxin-antitoxin system VapC family toxin [Chloroflexi bacterium]|nr:type II toxin-antitoxin system VapC family toxin [Chloroflexota bacterium]
MLLLDVNILVYAYREDAPDHRRFKDWLEGLINGGQTYGMSELVLSGFLRIVTHPAIFIPPSPMQNALAFVEQVKSPPNCVVLQPGPRHWQTFTRLCQTNDVRGNLVPDAYLAALAIESGSEWISTDSDYARFPELKWRRPF